MSRGRGGFIGATLQSMRRERPSQPMRANSQEFDEAKAGRLVRALTKRMHTLAAERDALLAMQYTYIVDTTLEEMEREAEAEQKLTELRIALLHVQPACKSLLADIRQMVMDTNGDKALVMLKYAVAWRRVFGPNSHNRLQAVLDLASMGAAVRNHVEREGAETVYLASAQALEAYGWNRRGTAMEATERQLGEGFGGADVASEPAVELTGSAVAPVPVVSPPAFDVEPRGRRIALPPHQGQITPQRLTPPPPQIEQPRTPRHSGPPDRHGFPHLSAAHPMHIQHQHAPAAVMERAAPHDEIAKLLENLPPASEQVARAMADAQSAMHRFAPARPAHPPVVRRDGVATPLPRDPAVGDGLHDRRSDGPPPSIPYASRPHHLPTDHL